MLVFHNIIKKDNSLFLLEKIKSLHLSELSLHFAGKLLKIHLVPVLSVIIPLLQTNHGVVVMLPQEDRIDSKENGVNLCPAPT